MASRILIADDNALVRLALGQALEKAGRWEIVEAENGEEAVTKARATKPKLVILDLAMPVMDGMRAARAITIALPGIPIILHTLHWSPRVEIEALKAGACKVVAKTDSATIIAAVRDLIAPEPLGYTATIEEPSRPIANGADITVIRPAPVPPVSLPAAGAAKKRTNAAAQRRSDESGPADR
ncbi:MAG TPA: response regulator transcription factor [Candidatus Sulfotelmatobacter sp.]|jgi:DNA-binding NarL/FixJ family response regulator